MAYQNLKITPETYKDKFRKRIKVFVFNLICFVDSLPLDRVGRICGDQLLRSGTSIGANYFEARAASSRNDYINYFAHSLKSANESKFWLEILLDAKHCNEVDAQRILEEVSEISNILASSILTLKHRK